MKRLLLIVVAACSSKGEGPPKVSPTTPSAGSWKPFLPAFEPEGDESAATVRIFEMSFDATGVWRCTMHQCVHAGLDGKVTARLELPCPAPVFSPSMTLVASACPTRNEQEQQVYEVTVSDLRRKTRETRPTKIEAGFRIVVDDQGVVTGINFPPSKVSRSSPATTTTLPITIPAATIDAGVLDLPDDSVIPATGPWLAFTIDRPGGDVAWRDDGSATLVKLDGNVILYDNDRFLMRTAGNKYVEVSANGQRPFAESPPLKLKDEIDDLGYVDRWGKDGIFAMYLGSSLGQLRDRDGRVRHVLPLPDIDGRPAWDPTGARAYFWYYDGRVLVWDRTLD